MGLSIYKSKYSISNKSRTTRYFTPRAQLSQMLVQRMNYSIGRLAVNMSKSFSTEASNGT